MRCTYSYFVYFSRFAVVCQADPLTLNICYPSYVCENESTNQCTAHQEPHALITERSATAGAVASHGIDKSTANYFIDDPCLILADTDRMSANSLPAQANSLPKSAAR